MTGFAAFLLRGMRWRLGTSVLTVLTSAIAVGAAVLGPLYLRTASDSVVRTTVRSAPIEARGATLSAAPAQLASLGQIEHAERVVDEAGGSHHWYGAPITSVLSGARLVGPGSSPLATSLFYRTGICGVLRFRAGSCDLSPGNVAISDRSARELGVSLGAVIDAAVGGRSPLRLRVTGIYSVPNLSLPYWWGNGPGYFPFGQTTGPSHIPEVDPFVASTATALDVPAQAPPEIIGEIPLRPGQVGVGDEAAVRRALSHATDAVAADGILLNSQLSPLLAGADRQRHVMSTIVAIAAVQLVLLAIWVLGSLLVRSSDARQSEARVARLRGFPAASMLAVTAAEPAALCLLGIVLGVAAAWAAVVVARGRLLDPSAVITPDGWVFVAFAAVVVAIAGALGVGMMRLLRSSGLSASQPLAGVRRAASVVVDAMLVVLSLVALVALGTSGSLAGHSNPIASAAPGLIALGAAVIAVQLVLFACRLGVSASAYSQRVGTFLALRQIVRRPVVLRHARVLIIALCLACFAAAAWSVARTNRASAASFSVGTSTVATVTPQGVGLEQAVDRVDPGGRYAMAAVTVRTQNSYLLAVDARRLPVAASWPKGISRSTVLATSRALDPRTAPEVTLAGASVRLTATTSATPRLAAGLAHLDVGLWVFNDQIGTSIVSLGELHRGAFTYRGSLALACPGGCRLAGLGLVPAPGRQAPSSGDIELDLTRISTSSPSGSSAALAADLFAGGWRSTATGVRVDGGTGGGLTFAIPASATSAYTGAAGASIPPMVSLADHPAILPGAVTSNVQSLNGNAALREPVPTQGLDGNSVSVSPTVTASALPRLGSYAVMVDLDLLGRAQVSPTSAFASDQVWLGPSAPKDVLARLQAAGLRVDSVQRASALFRQLERSGPALADDFLLLATVAALLVAAASTLGALGATTRQRATELTALEVAGVSRRVLARSLAVESGILAGTALFGAGAGVLAALMAIPSLPELATPSVIPLQYGLPGILIAAVSASVIGAVLAASIAMSVILIRRMSPSLLRTAPNGSSG
jgi:putative ABC transport system permease protein